MFSPTELLWALIGLILTIGGTFIDVFVTDFPWHWSNTGIPTYSLGVTCQVGAVLLVGCVGGKNAGALSQIAYLVLGFTGYAVFDQGSGLGYLKQPSFGYILGFVPGAWLCGFLAFKRAPKLENLAFSCICGLIVVHIIGLCYLILSHYIGWAITDTAISQDALRYSFYALPGQLALICAITVLSFILRRLMFY